nr:multiple organellar RNA editing factor 8, chloroplastic/mitochondrial-like [Tanacetum cinerariifolium]
MATRIFLRTLTSKTLILSPRSFSTTTTNTILRLRPLITAATLRHAAAVIPTSSRAFSTRQTTSSLNDPNPNWSNRPPKETILLDGCDFEHWLVVVEKPEGEPTRDEIIDSYINTLAKVVGSYDEARMKIYSVSTRCYYAFGALVSEEDSYKLKEVPGVRWVLPDSYLDVKNKDYGGEPFIDGVAVPYDPKYHEEWIRNNARANERNRRNDRPRNFDRSRNFERRRENMQTNRSPPGGGPPSNMGGPPNAGGAPPPPSGNMGGMQQGGGMGGPPPPGNMGGMQQGGGMGGPPNAGGGQPNWGAPRPNYNAGPPNMGGGMPPSNMGGGMPNNAPNYQQQQPPRYGHSGGAPYQSGPGTNSGGMPYQSGPGPNSGGSYQSGPGPNSGGQSYQSGPGPNSYAPNAGGGNPYQTQDMPGRDVPPPPHYSQNY